MCEFLSFYAALSWCLSTPATLDSWCRVHCWTSQSRHYWLLYDAVVIKAMLQCSMYTVQYSKRQVLCADALLYNPLVVLYLNVPDMYSIIMKPFYHSFVSADWFEVGLLFGVHEARCPVTSVSSNVFWRVAWHLVLQSSCLQSVEVHFFSGIHHLKPSCLKFWFAELCGWINRDVFTPWAAQQ